MDMVTHGQFKNTGVLGIVPVWKKMGRMTQMKKEIDKLKAVEGKAFSRHVGQDKINIFFGPKDSLNFSKKALITFKFIVDDSNVTTANTTFQNLHHVFNNTSAWPSQDFVNALNFKNARK